MDEPYNMYIYKYRDFNINSLKALHDNKLWFSRGVKFNDPFDCTLDVPFTIIDESSLRDFITLNPHNSMMVKYALNNKEVISNVVKAQFKKSVELINENGIESHSLGPLYEFVMVSLLRSFVCCFSTESTNRLLWSHYASSHSGFCIRFKKDLIINELPIHEGNNVTYSNSKINLMHSLTKGTNPARDIIFTKSDDWSYEKEYRIIHKDLAENDDDDYRITDYPEEAIDMIILGYKFDLKNLPFLKSIIANRNIMIKKIKRDDNSNMLFVDTEYL